MNPYSDRTRGSDLAGYLEYRGLAASAPRQKPAGGPAADHEDRRLQRRRDPYPAHDRLPRETFKVTSVTATDPAIRADVVVTIGADTPRLTAPPLS